MLRPALAALLAVSVLGASDLSDAVHEYELKNGLKVIVYVDSSAPVVSTQVWYRVGAYDEPLGKTGISHMAEHMTFKHTDRYEPGTFHRIVDEAGGYNNGFTSTYYTGYYEDLARDRWELALELESARMSSCVFDNDEFQRERQVVTEEWRLGENRPSSRLWKEFEAAAYMAHPHRNPVIGWGDDIARYTCEAVEDWYRTYYNPANAVVVVGGDVEPEDAIELVRKHFGQIEGRPVRRTDYYDLEPKQKGERRVVLRDKVSVPVLRIGYHIPGLRDSTAFFAGDMLSGILAGGRTSRLYRRLVAETGLATSVYAYSYITLDPGLFVFSISPRSEEDIPEIERLVYEEIERFKSAPISDREMAQVRNGVLANQVFARDRFSSVARILGSYQVIYGDWRFYERQMLGIGSATRDDMKRLLTEHLVPDNRTVAMLLPEETR